MPLPSSWEALTLVSLDFETYWGKEYTLRKLPTSDYVRDDRFKAHMVGVKINDAPTELILHRDIPKRFSNRGRPAIKWDKSMLLCHNTLFDGLIMSHHYGVIPKVYLDTLAMARGLHGNQIRADLDTVARFYGEGNKVPDVLSQSKDVFDLELPEYADLLVNTGAYCITDVDIMYRVFLRMLPKMPADELRLIDLTTRCFCAPVLTIDTKLAAKVRDEEVARRRALFRDATGIDVVDDESYEQARKSLKKDEVFADMIRSTGWEPPTKWSEKQEKEIYAFAKADLEGFLEEVAEIDEVPDELEAAVEARIAANSTISITRAQRFIDLRKKPDWKAPIGYRFFAAHTGRWGGTDKRNFQNLGRGGELRLCIMAASPTEVLGVVDSGQIEARVLAWVAGAEWKLKAFREYDTLLGKRCKKTGKVTSLGKKTPAQFLVDFDESTHDLQRAGPDMYRLAYHRAFSVPLDEVTKEQRQLGKVAELACLARGTLVLTDHGEVPIEDVSTHMQVWDGDSWVAHGGVIYRGEKDVYEYDGLVATLDHVVWVEGRAAPVTFETAIQNNYLLLKSGASGRPLRLGRNSQPHTGVPEELAGPLCTGAVHGVRASLVDLAVQPDQREEQGMPSLLATKKTAAMAGQETHGSQAALHKPERRGLPKLWGARHRISLRERAGGGRIHAARVRCTESSDGARPHQHGRALRTGQPAVGKSASKPSQPAPRAQQRRVVCRRLALRVHRGSAHAESRTNARANSGRGTLGSKRETQKLALYRGKTSTFDLLNCGPNNRFTAGSALVHNCGYQGAAGAFGSMAKVYGVKLPSAEVNRVVKAWRKANPEVVKFWETCELVLSNLCLKRSGTFGPGGILRYGMDGKVPCIWLPNGMALKYPGLTGSYDSKRQRFGNFCYQTTMGLKHTYGGSICENIVQALARIVVGEQMLEIQDSLGKRIVMMTHDETVAILNKLSAKQDMVRMLDVFMTPPAWAPELPVTGDGGYDRRYSK